QSIATPASAISAAKNQPPSQVAPTATGSITAADRMRSFRPPDFGRGVPSLTAAAIAPLTAMILIDRRGEVVGREVGPELVGEDQFTVGRLPEQEIRKPLLAAGPDDQVGIGNADGLQMVGHGLGGDVLHPERASSHLFRNPAAGGHDLVLAAVTERDDKGELAVLARARFGIRDEFDDVGGQLGAIADHMDTHAAALEL